MSYLEMSNTPLPDMKKGIISLWFRDATKGTAPPPDVFPTGVWTPGTESMVPPDTQAIVNALPYGAVFYWNAYGTPVPLFGGFLSGPASMYMPWHPPFPIDSIHMLLTFGNPNQTYNYYPWSLEQAGVIDAVSYLASEVVVSTMPPPYKVYNHFIGDDGKFKIVNMRIDSSVAKSNMVPQSFIGVDEDGYLIICLQTNTKATYKGCAFMLDRITEMWATATELIVDGPPFSYTQVGFPYPDGHWIARSGYWNGYQFEYKDISNEIMGAQPETFVIGGPAAGLDFAPGPRVSGSGWHHLLLSFDISGAVSSLQPDDVVGTNPMTETACKAWLAVDDRNYTGTELQHRLRLHDGFMLPLLPGVGHDIFPFGPVTSYSRPDFSPPLKPNDILPQGVWVRGFSGTPRIGLPRFASNAPVMQTSNAFANAGDFDPLYWTGAIWPLYGNGVAPGPWLPVLDPPRPSVPDPKQFDLPQYECASFNLPVSGHPIGVPTSTRHLKHNTGIEMGELQIWANRTLNAGDVKMRRLFVDEDGKPVPPRIAEKILGKPDVLLHGTNNWKKGFNTGRSGVDDEDKTIAAGQFRRVAKIERFVPDPELGK